MNLLTPYALEIVEEIDDWHEPLKRLDERRAEMYAKYNEMVDQYNVLVKEVANSTEPANRIANQKLKVHLEQLNIIRDLECHLNKVRSRYL